MDERIQICPHCAREVSPSDVVCPHCGRPVLVKARDLKPVVIPHPSDLDRQGFRLPSNDHPLDEVGKQEQDSPVNDDRLIKDVTLNKPATVVYPPTISHSDATQQADGSRSSSHRLPAVTGHSNEDYEEGDSAYSQQQRRKAIIKNVAGAVTALLFSGIIAYGVYDLFIADPQPQHPTERVQDDDSGNDDADDADSESAVRPGSDGAWLLA